MNGNIISLTRNDEDVRRYRSMESKIAVRPQSIQPVAVRPTFVRPEPVRPRFVHPEPSLSPKPVRPAPVRPTTSRIDPIRPAVDQQQLRPVAVKAASKPFAMKVARPIPQKATEKFYQEAHRHGITATDLHMAVMESHDWHRKWTQQDEEGHTMPEPQLDSSERIYSSVPKFLLDREGGARNPGLSSAEVSPAEIYSQKRARISGHDSDKNDNEHEREEDDVLVVPDRQGEGSTALPRHVTVWDTWHENSYSTLYDSCSSAEKTAEGPAVKRRLNSVGEGVEIAQNDDDGRELEMRPPPTFHNPEALVRPVAIRAVPLIFDALKDGVTEVPQQIHEHRVAIGGNVSPLTHGSGMTSETNNDAPLDDDRIPTFIEENYQAMSDFDSEDDEHSLFDCDPRDSLLHEIVINGGDGSAERFQTKLTPLAEEFKSQKIDTCVFSTRGKVEGSWLTLTKPTFFGNLGENDDGDPLYTLGRMSFDMFSPTGIVCSLQGNFNQIELVNKTDRQAMLDSGLVPKSLREEVEKKEVILRTYNVITAFTIEPPMAAFPKAPNKDVHRPIRGIMHTYGYTIPDPEVENRHSIWITGGRIEPNDCIRDSQEWKRLFKLHPPKHSLGEKAKLLAVKLLMGANVPETMDDNGTLAYSFTRPLGGHGVAYVDVVYIDGSLRIVKGHRGTIFVFTRMENNQKYLS